MSDYDWYSEELLPGQTSDDVDEPSETDPESDDLERLRENVPPHHGD